MAAKVFTESIKLKVIQLMYGFKTMKNNPFKTRDYLMGAVSSLNIVNFWPALLPVLFEMVLFHFTITLLFLLLIWRFILYPFSFENIIFMLLFEC